MSSMEETEVQASQLLGAESVPSSAPSCSRRQMVCKSKYLCLRMHGKQRSCSAGFGSLPWPSDPSVAGAATTLLAG